MQCILSKCKAHKQ
uniref:Uncharacterized protein n=1 Tax=Arundo donax TaxID=35708 RepID=A0A0A9FX66_ARUDO